MLEWCLAEAAEIPPSPKSRKSLPNPEVATAAAAAVGVKQEDVTKGDTGEATEAAKEVKAEDGGLKPQPPPPPHLQNYPDCYGQHYTTTPHNDLSSAFINCNSSGNAVRTPPSAVASRSSANNNSATSKSNKNRPNAGILLFKVCYRW